MTAVVSAGRGLFWRHFGFACHEKKYIVIFIFNKKR